MPICEHVNGFHSLISLPSLFNFASLMSIVIQSAIFRAIFVCLTQLTSFKSDTARVRFTTVSVLLIFFYNFGIMYLIAPLNFNTEKLELFFNGLYTDFNQHWFD